MFGRLFKRNDESSALEVNEPCDHDFDTEFETTNWLDWHAAEIHGDYLVVPRVEEGNDVCSKCGEEHIEVRREEARFMDPVEFPRYRHGEQLVVPIAATLPADADAEESLRERTENPSGEGIEVNTTEHKFDLTD